MHLDGESYAGANSQKCAKEGWYKSSTAVSENFVQDAKKEKLPTK
jgi:hypothetical protein